MPENPITTHLSYSVRSWFFVGLLLSLTLILGACGAASESTPPPTANESLVFAGDFGSLRTLDPAAAYELDSYLILGNIYETLVSYDPNSLELTGVLAKSWTIEEQGETWVITFTLDEQATFASGNPVTADDVLFSWRRAIEHNQQPAFLFTEIAQLDPQQLRAIDPQTVEVTLPATSNPHVFLSILSFSAAAILDRQEIAAHAPASDDPTWFNQHSAGSGPYRLERWQQDEHLVLVANAAYWQEPPAIKQVILRDIADHTDLPTLVASGEADIVQDLTTTQAASLADHPDVQIVPADTLDLVYIGMNITRALPLAHPDVREAIRYAINYDDLQTLLGNNATIVQEIIPDGIPGHTGQTPFQHDPERAGELLARSGVEPGTELELLIPTGVAPGGVDWRTLAAKIQSDLERVGLHLTVKPSDRLLDTYRARKHEMAMTLWVPDFPDPDANVTPFADAAAHSLAWRNHWDAPDIAALVREAATTQNGATRTRLYRTIIERVQHEGPYVVLYQPSRLFGVHRSVTGFRYVPADTPMVSLNRLEKK
jgi:peptide/nickel transport system substrate-binding protein